MSTLRRTFKVSWDNGDLVEITSNARDMAAAQEYAHDPAMGTFALIHHALRRCGYSVPKLEKFVDLLDEMQPADEDPEEAGLEPLPTSLEAFGPGPSPLRSSQEPTPVSGSMTTEPSSQRNAS